MPIKRMRRAKYPYVIFALLGFALLLGGAASVYFLNLQQTEHTIKATGEKIRQDISYKNGQWDLSAYRADPEVPGPYRLYLIATNGYVLERWRPIPGYLDTSDAKNLLSYMKPTTIHTVTGQNWRLLTQPVVRDGQQLGVITVASPRVEGLGGGALDRRLIHTASRMQELVARHGDGITVIDGLGERAMPYDISVQVVDQYNRIVIKNSNIVGGIPNYIDPSYIQQELGVGRRHTVVDTKKGESFLVLSWPIRGANHSPVGVLIIARTITPIYTLVQWYVIVMMFLEIFLFFGAWRLLRRLAPMNTLAADVPEKLPVEHITEISFSKQSCMLHIDECKIPITFATNQYYLCEVLFSNPRKKWESDVLLEHFGEEVRKHSWRKIYDAMAALNKKAGEYIQPKLIVVNNKAYQINPELQAKVRKHI